jgi:hypothetical protein
LFILLALAMRNILLINTYRKAFIIAFFIVCIIASCQSGNTPITPEQSETVKTNVQQFADSIAISVTHDGPIAWLKYFNDSPDFFMISDGQMVFPDHEAADKFIKTSLIKIITGINLKWNNTRIDPLTPDMALIASGFHEDLTDNKGLITKFDGYFTAIAQKTTKGWRLRDAHWSIKH